MRVMVIGTGYVGSAYARMLHYLGFHPLILSRSWLDYTNPEELEFVLRSYQPDWVINCAGYAGRTVDDCETNCLECYDANLVLPYNIALACGKIPLIHISTGCVFDGPGQFTEEDCPNFLRTVYGVTKLNAEQEILNIKDNCWIFRIRMPFNHQNHPRNWLTKIKNYERILDGINSVTFLDEFCMRSWQLSNKAKPGIYHAAYSIPVSTLVVARMIRPDVVEYDPDEFLKHHVPRSAAVLDCSKFEKAYGATFGDPMCAIRWCLAQMEAATMVGDRSGCAVERSDLLTISDGASARIGYATVSNGCL
jgi:dTDP-4-dehydrorhamnose reductase